MSIEATDLAVDLDRRSVLSGVNISVPTGSWTAVIGPNGAGKSTLLRAVLGLLPSRGIVTVDGVDLRGLGPRRRARTVSYVPQEPRLPAGMTVLDYTLLGRSPHIPLLGREGAADRRIVGAVLERLGLSAFAGRDVERLSGGERQRVVLARALAQETSVLLLDEPTTALDIGHQQQVMELIDRLRRDDGLTVVTTLHDLSLAAQYADALVLLSAGTVAAAGTPAEVLTQAAIAEHFAARVAVRTDAAGRPVLELERPPR